MRRPKKWRQGTKVKLNIYEGNRSVCQCHRAKDAARIVDAVNALRHPSIRHAWEGLKPYEV